MKGVFQNGETHRFVLTTIADPALLREMLDDAGVKGFPRKPNARFEVVIEFLRLVPEEMVRLRVGLLSIHSQPLLKLEKKGQHRTSERVQGR
jgi:hypothetical protein